MRAMKHALAAFGLLGATGAGACNQSIPSDIPCRSDSECPTAFFCGGGGFCTPNATPGAISGPEKLAFLGVSTGKVTMLSKTVEASRKGNTAIGVTITNVGGAESSYPSVTFVAASCLHIDSSLASNLLGIIQPKGIATGSVYVNPDPGCPSPVRVAITMSSRKPGQEARVSTDGFEVSLK
jgi:hypothetical protein